MERKKKPEKSFDLSVFWHNFKRTFPRLFWLPLVLGAVLGLWEYRSLTKSFTPVYEASSIYRVTATRIGSMDITSNTYYLDSNAASNLASSYSYIMGSAQAQDLIKELCGTASLPAKVTCRSEAVLLIFTAKGSDPDKLVKAIQVVEEVFPEVATTIRGRFTLELFEALEKPTTPINKIDVIPGVTRYALIGVAIGLALISFVAWLRKTVHNSEDLRQLLNVPCLGLLPMVRFKARTKQNTTILISNRHLDENYTEAIRGVRFQLRKELERQNSRIIMVTSTSPGEGKSTVSANLALSLAEQGSRVILVDCDLRKQSLRKLFEVKGHSYGLVDLISGRAKNLDSALVDTGLYGLRLLSGDKIAEQPQNFLSSPRLQEIMQSLREQADYIIVDTPPSGLLSDAASLSDWVDGTIYIVRQDFMSRPAILDSVQRLGNVDIRFIGCIINMTARRTSSSGYGYSTRKGSGYGYGYGYGYGGYGGYGSYGSYGYGKKSRPSDDDDEPEEYQK